MFRNTEGYWTCWLSHLYTQARNSNHHEGSSLLTIQEGKWDKIKHWSGKQTLHCVFLDSTFSPFFNYLVQFCPQIERKLFTYMHVGPFSIIPTRGYTPAQQSPLLHSNGTGAGDRWRTPQRRHPHPHTR